MDGTPPQICLADHVGEFAPTPGNDLQVGTPTDVEMDMGAVADAAYYKGEEIDFGAHWALEYRARMCVELDATPTAGNTIELWMGYTDATGVGEPGGLDGTKGTYTGYSSNAADSILQLDLVSVFVAS